MRKTLEAVYKLSPERIREIPGGVTVPWFSEVEQQATRRRVRGDLNVEEEARVLLFPGRDFLRDGLRHLFEALARPESGDWRLLAPGHEDPARYQGLARSMGLAGRVQFLGPRRDVHDLILAADAVVLPTYYAPCSRVVLEGLVLGRPCVTTRYDGAADRIVSGKNGFVLSEPGATDELAQALGRLRDEEFRWRMGENALRLREELSTRRQAQRLMELYETIVQNR